MDAIKAREEAAAKRVVEEEKRLGVGVSLDGQRIYDAFAKTYRPTFFGDSFAGVVFGGGKLTCWGRLPVKWVDKSILVADQALINPPYTVESVVSVTSVLNGGAEDNGKSALLTRVKHVVRFSLFSAPLQFLSPFAVFPFRWCADGVVAPRPSETGD